MGVVGCTKSIQKYFKTLKRRKKLLTHVPGKKKKTVFGSALTTVYLSHGPNISK